MNKLFTKIAALALGATMAVGVGVAVASNREDVPVHAATTTDTITADDLEATGTSYVAFEVSKTATYIGNSAKNGENMQFNSNGTPKNRCIATSVSGGTIKSVSISYGNANGKTITVYVSNSAYSISEAFNSGTSAGTLSTSNTTVTISGTYSHVALFPSGATYPASISFEWETGGGQELTPMTAPTLSLSGTVVSWTNISGNNGYSYSITGTESKSGSLAANTTSLDVSGLGLAYGSYSITVVTKGDGTTTSDSPASTAQSFTLVEPTVSGAFNLFSGTLVEGDYILTSGSSIALKSGIANTSRIAYASVTPSNNSISNPGESIVWHLAKSGNYWTIYNAASDKYAGSTSSKNQGTMLDDATTDNAKWELSGSYDFLNVARAAGSDSGNKYLRYNDGYGFACYTSSTGSTLTLYKKYVSYTVQYDANTGSGTMANSETIVSACTFIAPNTGKEFDHWNTASDNSGVSYNPGDSVTSNCTLYAIWKDKIASVSVSPTSLALEIGGSSETVTATPTNIDNPTYKWTIASGDNCVSFANDTANPVTISVANGITSSSSCVVRVTATGTLGGNSVSRTADVEISVIKTSTQDNPYTVSEAVVYATAQGTSQSSDLAYVRGYLAIKNSGGSQLFLTDDPDSIDVTKTYSTDEKHAMLCVYKSGGVTDISSVNVGDQVLISGYPVLYNGNQPEFADGVAISSVAETMTINKTVVTDTLTVNSAFSYSGVVSIDYTHKTDVANANALVTFSGYNMASTGSQTVTISYSDTALGKEASTTYTLNVEYAAVSTVTLNHSAITVEPVSETNFSVTLNSNVDPSSIATWTVDNDAGSSLDLNNYAIESTGNLTATLTCIGDSTDSGVLIVTATVGGVSDTCTVTVTGDAYVTFNKDSIQGIVGANLNNSVTVTPVGLGTPTGYTWSIKSGEATDVVNATTGSATSTLTFLKAGSTVLHVVVTDGTDSAEGDIQVNVIKSLNTISTSSTDVQTKTFNFSEIALAEGWENSQAYTEYTISPVSIEAQGGGNNGKWYTSSGGSWRMYSGGTLEITASDGYSVTSVTSSPSCDFEISNGVATFSPSGRTDFTSLEVTCEKTVAGQNINNTNYNAQKAVIEFAEDLTTKLNAVCLQDSGGTNVSALNTAWTNIQSTYNAKRNALSSSDESVFDALIANASKDENGDSLQKALSSYDFVYAKYHDSLTAGDFLHEYSGRGAVTYLSNFSPVSILNSENTNVVIIVLIISAIGVSAIGGYFFLRKRKEEN